MKAEAHPHLQRGRAGRRTPPPIPDLGIIGGFGSFACSLPNRLGFGTTGRLGEGTVWTEMYYVTSGHQLATHGQL